MTGEAPAGIPPPLDNDDDDVAWALQTAAAQWKHAAFADAIVWLRRAVDSAIQAGHAARANELSGAAWRLTEQMLAQAEDPKPAPSADSAGDVDDLLGIPPSASGDRISVAFEVSTVPGGSLPDYDTERNLASSPPVGARPLPQPRAQPRARDGHKPGPAIRPPPPRDRRAPPPPPTPPDDALPSFPLEPSIPPPSPFDREEPSDTVVPPEPQRDTEAPPDPFATELPPPESEPTIVAQALTALNADSIPAPPSVSPAPASRATPPPPSAGREAAAAAEPLLAGVSLADVRGLQDLPEDAQEKLVEQARIERLSRNDELTGFGVALVLDGWISIMPAIAEVPCARATSGDVVCASGTLDEAILLSAVAGQDGTLVAIWDKAMLEEATADCPWVADELKLVADRYQTLAGVTMGAMGDRLDESLRAMVTERCEVRALIPNEVLVDKGGTVPGLYIVGAGRIEIVEGVGADAEVLDEFGPGDFLFAAQVLQGGTAPSVTRAGKSGALVLFAERKVAHELLVSVPPLLEIFAT